jgi:PDZ domain
VAASVSLAARLLGVNKVALNNFAKRDRAAWQGRDRHLVSQCEERNPHMRHRPAAKPVDKWWDRDPYALGGGLGIVLHANPRNRWVVANVLRKSPAELAGVLRGDYVVQIDAYSLTAPDADIVEVLGLIRAGKAHARRLVLERESGIVKVRIVAKPMRSLLRVAARLGQELGGGPGGGGGCSSCRSCTPTVIGWLDCGTGRRCQDRCLIA